MQENILSNVVLIETNLSRGGKIWNQSDKTYSGQVVFNLETFLTSLADTSFRLFGKCTQTKFSFRQKSFGYRIKLSDTGIGWQITGQFRHILNNVHITSTDPVSLFSKYACIKHPRMRCWCLIMSALCATQTSCRDLFQDYQLLREVTQWC